MNRSICMDLGETRHVQLLVKNIKGTDFTITTAIWLLQDKYGKDAESRGDCAISDHVLDALITPHKAGVYMLKYVYQIMDETLIDIIDVVVNGC